MTNKYLEKAAKLFETAVSATANIAKRTVTRSEIMERIAAKRAANQMADIGRSKGRLGALPTRR